MLEKKEKTLLRSLSARTALEDVRALVSLGGRNPPGGDRARAGPPGLFGGRPGARFRGVLIREDGRKRLLPG